MSYMGKVRPTVALTSSDIVDGAITTDKIVDDAVTDAKVANAINTSIAANTSKVTNATHTGDVTGATALTIAADAVDIAMLSATGTADATTFLRGDNSWTAAGGDNTPAFQASLGANQTGIANDTTVKITFDTVLFDTDSAYDNTTNYRFTVPAGEGGKYFVYARTICDADAQGVLNYAYLYIQLNGSAAFWSATNFRNNPAEYVAYMSQGILTLSAADYLECSVYFARTDAGTSRLYEHGKATTFGAFKLIGL